MTCVVLGERQAVIAWPLHSRHQTGKVWVIPSRQPMARMKQPLVVYREAGKSGKRADNRSQRGQRGMTASIVILERERYVDGYRAVS
jgi:hypothetical protein